MAYETLINKIWAQQLADSIPASCPGCNSTKNFKYTSTPTNDKMLALGPHEHLYCLDCSWNSNITPHYLW